MKFIIVLLALYMVGLQSPSMSLYNGENKDQFSDWWVVDDTVMGGVSQGSTMLTADGNLQFSGTVSLENNGGFSSIRYNIDVAEVGSYAQFKLKVKGDGKKYSFRVTKAFTDGYTYEYIFETTGEWEEIYIPYNQLKPVWRGRNLELPNYEGNQLQGIGILIGNKENQSFSIEVSSVEIVR